MSILASSILTETYQILGRPSQQDLPYLDLLVIVKDVARGRILDQKLSAKNHTMAIGGWVTPSAREMSSSGFVGGLENFIPVKVEWQYISEASITPAPYPRRAEVVSFEMLGDKLERSSGLETHVAFYDGFASIAFSENTSELALRQYRIVYEDTSDITLSATSDSVALPDLFITLCKYEAGLVALNQIKDSSPEWADMRERLRTDFGAQVAVWTDRFQKWQRSTWGNKKVKKQSANSRRFLSYGR